MIKVENVSVFNFMGAIHGMRNPLESWDKIDSYEQNGIVFLGNNDLGLMKKLFNAGRDHRKFTRQILVSMDITAPDYFFREFDTYKIGATANSTSQMHKIMSKPFTMDMFSCENLIGYKKEVQQFIPKVDTKKEVWKKVKDNDLYLVSNFGRVKRLTYIGENGLKYRERILSYSVSSDKYMKANLITKDGRKDFRVHRLVAEAFIPNPDNKPFINHKDGNKFNNTVDNLEWCTQQENIDHSFKNNLQPKLKNTYAGKFDESTREIIKQLYNDGVSMRQIAIKYNVSHTCISDIIKNKYKYQKYTNEYKAFKHLLKEMNNLREEWLKTKDPEIWKKVVQMCPQSWNYTRHLTLNYEVLYNIYYSRKTHKLIEWREFCDIIKHELPYFKEIASMED